jgi:hypothetical protein
MNEFYDQQKQTHGSWAMIVWIAAGIYLFATTGNAKFLSWQAALYFVGGMFGSALVFGAIGYVMQRGVARILMLVFEPSPRVAVFVVGLGFALFAIDALLVILGAKATVTYLH